MVFMAAVTFSCRHDGPGLGRDGSINHAWQVWEEELNHAKEC